jgi:hypothetical protein
VETSAGCIWFYVGASKVGFGFFVVVDVNWTVGWWKGSDFPTLGG